MAKQMVEGKRESGLSNTFPPTLFHSFRFLFPGTCQREGLEWAQWQIGQGFDFVGSWKTNVEGEKKGVERVRELDRCKLGRHSVQCRGDKGDCSSAVLLLSSLSLSISFQKLIPCANRGKRRSRNTVTVMVNNKNSFDIEIVDGVGWNESRSVGGVRKM